MRRLFTVEEATRQGLTRDALRWGERAGRWRRVDRCVYAEGPEEPDAFDAARARVLASDGVASGRLAGLLHRLDGVTELDDRPLRRRALHEERVIVLGAIRCTDGRTPGVRRMRRVLAARPETAPPTESLLETLMVQLVRGIAGLPEPTRQHEVVDQWGSSVARVDLSWPELGLFLELDGQHHEGQPQYDARRETAVVAKTGWLPGRFTWHEVVSIPTTTARRVVALAEQAQRRLGGVSG
jgi:hypothetical protein